MCLLRVNRNPVFQHWLKGENENPPIPAYNGEVTGVYNPNGGACRCGSDGNPDKPNGISLNRFYGDKTDQKIWGCGGAFQLTGASAYAQFSATFSTNEIKATAMAGLNMQFGQSDSYLGWEACCYVCGATLQVASRLSPGWYCERDALSTGIWLKGNPNSVDNKPGQVVSVGPVSGFCDPNGGACKCGSDGGADGNTPIVLNRFWEEQTDTQVSGCGGNFQLSGLELGVQWQSTGLTQSVGGSMGLDFSAKKSYLGWEACCYICGANLQLAGKLLSGWYCEKDGLVGATGIWLKGARKDLLGGSSSETDQSKGPVSGFCGNNGSTCKCAADGNNIPITLEQFSGDNTNTRVMGCGGAFQLTNLQLKGQWQKELEGSSSFEKNFPLINLSTPQIFNLENWETCCRLCGTNLAAAGKLTGRWTCKTDFFRTGIWLRGKNMSQGRIDLVHVTVF